MLAPRVIANKSIDKLIQGLNILTVDNNSYMRRLTRTKLTNLGAKSVVEVGDGLAALEAIRTCDPDITFLDWDMPVLNGIEVMRIVRSPGVFPRPNLPNIMLTNRAQRSAVSGSALQSRARIPAQANLAQGAVRRRAAFWWRATSRAGAEARATSA